MSVSLPNAKPEYDPQDEAQTRALVEAADAQNIKLDQIITKLYFRDTSTLTIRTVVVTAGAFVIT